MPIVTLLTDFGLNDTYVAQMKGVVLSIAPDCTLVDITHAIPAQNVLAGAAALREAAVRFPPQSIHVAVVDPGVGTSRRLVGVQIADRLFVLPDNGLLSRMLTDFELQLAVELTERNFWQPEVSDTFHGRDIMAPVAAHLASGIPLGEFGPPVSTLTQLTEPQAKRTAAGISAVVVAIDHFGNATTNIQLSLLQQAFSHLQTGDMLEVEHQHRSTLWQWNRTYGAVDPAVQLALIGSQGYLELAVNRGSAAAEHGISIGDQIFIRATRKTL